MTRKRFCLFPNTDDAVNNSFTVDLDTFCLYAIWGGPGELAHNKDFCDQRRLRSAHTSVQFSQNLHWSHMPTTAYRLSKEGYTRTLIILGECTGWSESAGPTSLFVGFIVRWLIFKCIEQLTLVLLFPDMPCLCKWCRSRSVGLQLIWICTVCH